MAVAVEKAKELMPADSRGCSYAPMRPPAYNSKEYICVGFTNILSDMTLKVAEIIGAVSYTQIVETIFPNKLDSILEG